MFVHPIVLIAILLIHALTGQQESPESLISTIISGTVIPSAALDCIGIAASLLNTAANLFSAVVAIVLTKKDGHSDRPGNFKPVPIQKACLRNAPVHRRNQNRKCRSRQRGKRKKNGKRKSPRT